MLLAPLGNSVYLERSREKGVSGQKQNANIEASLGQVRSLRIRQSHRPKETRDFIFSLFQTSTGYILLDAKQSHTPIMQMCVFVTCTRREPNLQRPITPLACSTLYPWLLRPLRYCSFCSTRFHHTIARVIRRHWNWLASSFRCQTDHFSEHQFSGISS